ncbi:MAG: flagellar motor switch phosphatase FliY [Angelakisella sp.]|nr:flagellar motor switch phosphatase FliY [Angelakisella sp.]
MSVTNCVLSGSEIDVIGEILNISMGSSATAISTMLDKQVIITTPKVVVTEYSELNYKALEPAMLVKIEYVSGIIGANVMVFRQTDMQIILNLLMGNEAKPTDDFVFDELSISAACEVMNQMMGASATALSSFLGKNINISTPEAYVNNLDTLVEKIMGAQPNQSVVSVKFDLQIDGVMNSEFVSVMNCDLAKSIVAQVMGEISDEPVPQPAQQPMMPHTSNETNITHNTVPNSQQVGYQPPQQSPIPPQYTEQAAYQYPHYPQYPQPSYGMYPPYGYNPMQQGMPMPEASAPGIMKQPVNVHSAQFPNFSGQTSGGVLSQPLSSSTMDLVLNVPLSVSVEIGKTKKKIKEIMDFSHGTVIELEKQAGAPVDIVVNGQLIARGDVVVIDDNFGVRVTEIVGTKELLDSL